MLFFRGAAAGAGGPPHGRAPQLPRAPPRVCTPAPHFPACLCPLRIHSSFPCPLCALPLSSSPVAPLTLLALIVPRYGPPAGAPALPGAPAGWGPPLFVRGGRHVSVALQRRATARSRPGGPASPFLTPATALTSGRGIRFRCTLCLPPPRPYPPPRSSSPFLSHPPSPSTSPPPPYIHCGTHAGRQSRLHPRSLLSPRPGPRLPHPTARPPVTAGHLGGFPHATAASGRPQREAGVFFPSLPTPRCGVWAGLQRRMKEPRQRAHSRVRHGEAVAFWRRRRRPPPVPPARRARRSGTPLTGRAARQSAVLLPPGGRGRPPPPQRGRHGKGRKTLESARRVPLSPFSPR